MAGKIISTNASRKRIRDVGAASPRIEPAAVATALGAEDSGIEIELKGSPTVLLQSRAELASRLQSSGGRPR
jgi:hypothetical protein